ncbi:MAG: RsmB/NOP family class I SAM-dependent RNA methyltransferase [Patescibacteria group bacterium]|nr:RsmB/NOP family class I SAM-dependent RNA methyltransferase [Patescibacteria group bacterium]
MVSHSKNTETGNFPGLPSLFCERVFEIAGPNRAPAILKSYTVPRPVSIRVNTLRSSREQVLESLSKQGISLQAVPWYRDAFITDTSSRILTATTLYNSGAIYLQGLSSMIPALVLDPRPGEKVLDMTAAPGSKTTQIAALMQNTGELVANDVSRSRLYKLKEILSWQGVRIARTENLPGQRIWERYKGYFDKVLLDAPCSLEGTFSTHDSDSTSGWSERKIKTLAKQQGWLLRSALSATRPGGIVVYSTCTLSPEENEGVLDWLLRRYPGLCEIIDSSLPHLQTDAAIVSWRGKSYDQTVTLSSRILPDLHREGFFLARIRKTG